jgi:hypothetical protein
VIVQLLGQDLQQYLYHTLVMSSSDTDEGLTPSCSPNQLLKSDSAPISSISGLLIVLRDRTSSTTAERNLFSESSDSNRSGINLSVSLTTPRQYKPSPKGPQLTSRPGS